MLYCDFLEFQSGAAFVLNYLVQNILIQRTTDIHQQRLLLCVSHILHLLTVFKILHIYKSLDKSKRQQLECLMMCLLLFVQTSQLNVMNLDNVRHIHSCVSDHSFLLGHADHTLLTHFHRKRVVFIQKKVQDCSACIRAG